MNERVLPLFPLPGVVLFPGCWLPLHIFEPRYREMINSVLSGDRTFGVLLMDPFNRTAARWGCSAEIVDFRPLPDGRMDIATVGRQRFRVLETNYDHNYLTGVVSWIDDEPAKADLEPAAQNVKALLWDVLRLFGKLSDRRVDFPSDLPGDPIDLSYWVAGTIHGLVDQQQELLELQDTERRLEREGEILKELRNELSARTALKEAFSE